jgi:hypothetical protein
MFDAERGEMRVNDQEIQVFTEQPFNSYLKKMFSSAGQ